MKEKRLGLALVALVIVTTAAGAFVIIDSIHDSGANGSAVSETAEDGKPALVAPAEPSPGDASQDAAAISGAPAAAGKSSHPAPKVQSSLADLAAVLAEGGPEAAESFAAQRGLKFIDGRVQLVVEASDTGVAEAQVKAAGGIIETSHGQLLQAMVPPEQLDVLSASPSVDLLRQPERPTVASLSEGVADIDAPAWHADGVSGAGVKVAIIDLGFQGYQNLISAGELPASVTTASFRTDGDINGGGEKHGSACAEVIHDIAPGAQLYLVNFATDVELANAIDYIIAHDIDVVSASWSFFGNFRGDGQGTINDMVLTAHNGGVFWANVAGNAAGDHWSGGFNDSDNDSWHEFGVGDDGNDLNAAAGTRIDVYITWDKWPVTDQDYDVYLVYEGNPDKSVAAGDSWQGGTQTPSEQIHYTVPPGKGGRYWIKIKNYSAAGDANFKLYTYPLHLQYQTPAGSLAGQPTDSSSVMTVGAVQVGTQTLETFSSRGPTVDGRVKPDIVAPDRVTTTTFGLTAFWGTSASAPHVAGAGALVLQAHPGYLPDQVQLFLEAQAKDLGVPGKDNLFGSGKLNLGTAPDLTPPVVSSVLPSGTIDATTATISADFIDTGSGVDTGSVSITLDGKPLSGCAVSNTGISCPVENLAGGGHTISGSLADNNGNSAVFDGTFFVTCFRPSLAIIAAQPSWASYQDYLNRELTVSYSLCNVGLNDSYNAEIVGTTSTNGVITISEVPLATGDRPREGQPGSCAPFTLTYLVPQGVESFRTVTYVTAEGPCGSSYEYPGPYIGAGG